MENLPLDEKIATKREAQVLERWLKREQEWEDIKAKVELTYINKIMMVQAFLGGHFVQRNLVHLYRWLA